MTHILQLGFYFAHNAWKLSKQLASLPHGVPSPARPQCTAQDNWTLGL